MVKVGVVGLGSMGQNHVRVYSELDCELVGVADVSLDRAKEIAGKYDVRYFSDYKKLIGEVEAVSIVVPTSLHSMVAGDFLKAGVHCLVEKPIASTMAEAKEMVHTANDHNVKLMVGHIERFNPAVTRLKKMIDESRLGKLIQISTRRVGPFAPRIRDVGIIIDSATHDIDIARYLLNMEPLSVYSRFGRLRHEKEDHAIIVLDFDVVTACIEVNWFSPQKVRTLVATGSEGTAYLDYIDQELTICNSHAPEKVDVQRAEPLKLELDHFLKCVEYNCPPLVDGVQGMNVLGIALEACKRKKPL
jgi:UDP-N-acetylglucosamine 3-dehydrogenase